MNSSIAGFKFLAADEFEFGLTMPADISLQESITDLTEAKEFKSNKLHSGSLAKLRWGL